MRSIYILGLLIGLTFILLIVLLLGRCEKSSPRPSVSPTPSASPTPSVDVLSKITKEIKRQIANLSDNPPSCQSDMTDGIIGVINDNISKGNDILSTNSSDPPTPTSINNFKMAVQIALDLITKVKALARCNCPQGSYGTNGECICPPEYPYQIKVQDGTIYCSNVNCQITKHGQFIPSPGTDPSKNSCSCDTSYILSQTDPSNENSPQDCYNLPATNVLNTYTDQINQFSSGLKQYLPRIYQKQMF